MNCLVGTRFTPDVMRQLRQVSADRDISLSELLRRAAANYLQLECHDAPPIRGRRPSSISEAFDPRLVEQLDKLAGRQNDSLLILIQIAALLSEYVKQDRPGAIAAANGSASRMLSDMGLMENRQTG